MTERPLFPPAFRPVRLDGPADLFAQARSSARQAAADGRLFWNRRADRMECALLLTPEPPARSALPVVCVAMAALADAVAAAVAPGTSVQYRWPDRLLVNGGLVGGLRAAWEEDWVLLGAAVAVESPEDEPGHAPDRTALREEGCGADVPGLLEGFCRHLLYWLDRWNEEGFGPVRASLLARCPDLGRPFAVPANLSGEMAGLDEEGGLVLATRQGRVTVGLAEALASHDGLPG